MEAKKLREAEDVLEKAVLAGEDSDSNVETENQASALTHQLGQLREMKSLCLYHLVNIVIMRLLFAVLSIVVMISSPLKSPVSLANDIESKMCLAFRKIHHLFIMMYISISRNY